MNANYLRNNNQAQNKITSFKNLHEGWDYGVGIPATSVAISSARQLLQSLKVMSLFGDAFPQTNGGITVHVWKESHTVLEIRVSPLAANRYDFMQEENIDGDLEITAEGENYTLEQLVPVLWKLSGLYISGNIILLLSGSLQIASQISGAVYLCSTDNVRKPTVVFATTSTSTTARRSETPLRTGQSHPQALRQSIST